MNGSSPAPSGMAEWLARLPSAIGSGLPAVTDLIGTSLRAAFPTAEGTGAVALGPSGCVAAVAVAGQRPETARWTDWLLAPAGPGWDRLVLSLEGRPAGAVWVLGCYPASRPLLQAAAGLLFAELRLAAALDSNARAQSRLLGDLSAGVTHSLNNILMGITLKSEFIGRRTPEAATHAEAIGRFINRGKQVTLALNTLAAQAPPTLPLDALVTRTAAYVSLLRSTERVKIRIGPVPEVAVETWPAEYALRHILVHAAYSGSTAPAGVISGRLCGEGQVCLTVGPDAPSPTMQGRPPAAVPCDHPLGPIARLLESHGGSIAEVLISEGPCLYLTLRAVPHPAVEAAEEPQ